MNGRYPEHEKLDAIKERSQAIGEFIDYGANKGLTLCYHHDAAQAGVPRWIDFETLEGVPFSDPRAVENPEFLPSGYYPTSHRIEQLLADWFDIDMAKIDDEKRQMLAELRAAS